MHRLQSSQRLVNEVLAVVIGQLLCANYSVHVGLHELLNEIDLSEGIVVPRLLDVEYGDDVLVVEVPEKLHLSQSSQTEHGMVEGCDLLDRNLLARGLV